MTYMQLIGVLEMYKMEMFCEAMSVVLSNSEESDDDDDSPEWVNTK